MKKIYAWEGIENFGDGLNKTLFDKLYGVQLVSTENQHETDIIAIGSVLQNFVYSGNKIKLLKQFCKIASKNIKKIDVLGAGFKREPRKFKFLRKMDFKIVRGKLTEQVLKKHGIINKNIPYGDLGILSSFANKKGASKYLLGIVPHYNDLNSPIFYDIYKEYGNESILINVRAEPWKVIDEISKCENIISSSLHGLIVADSYEIPNMWLENRFKSAREEPHFKYEDYYSSIGVEGVKPIQASSFLENGIESINRSWHKKIKEIEKVQKEVFDICKEYFSEKKNDT